MASRSLVTKQPSSASDEHLKMMRDLTDAGEKAYRNLTDGTEGFLDYFYETTPVTEIGLLNIGSRPSHRKATRDKSSIRAIPWVFGWAQSRTTLPAWYGIGTALEGAINADNSQLAALQEMNKKWPYFRALLSNTQMALSKADMATAKEYAELCEDPELSKHVYAMINDEYKRTVKHLLSITGEQHLLQESPSLNLSLSRRDPYLDPLSHIQILMLKRYRDESLNEDEQNNWLHPLLRTISAVAAGMRNTG